MSKFLSYILGVNALKWISRQWEAISSYLLYFWDNYGNYIIILFIVLSIFVIIRVIADLLEKRTKSKESENDEQIYKKQLSLIAFFLFAFFLVVLVAVGGWMSTSKEEKYPNKEVVSNGNVMSTYERFQKDMKDAKAGTIPRIEVEINGNLQYWSDTPANREMLKKYEEKGLIKILNGGSLERVK